MIPLSTQILLAPGEWFEYDGPSDQNDIDYLHDAV